jgi:hypothetical protein
MVSSGCLTGNVVGDKYYLNAYGNLTPAASLKYYVGNPTYVWAGGYFANLTTSNLNLYNTNTQISRDGLGNMIFTDAVSGTKTLADLAAGGGGSNVTGTGTAGKITKWNGVTTIGDATNTDAQVSDTVSKAHMQGTDTSLGVQAAVLNMGGNSITNVNLVDGKDVSTLGIGNITGSGSTNRLPYFSGAQTLGDSTIYYNVANARYGIGTVAPELMLHLHDGSSIENGIQMSYTIGSLYSNITSDMWGHLKLNPSGNLTINSGNLSMNTHYINNVVNPSVAQDAATKNYVDTAVAGVTGGSGNITGSGTNGYITMWTGASNITNATNTDIQVAAAVNAAHVQNTDTGLAAVGTKNPPIDADKALYRDSAAGDAIVTSTWAQIKAFLKTYFDTLYGVGNVTAQGNTGYIPQFSTSTNITNSIVQGNATHITVNGGIALTQNITLASGMTVDGVDISALTAGSGNVTVTGSTAGYIPKFSSTTNIVNSIMSESGTTVTAAGNISASRLISTVAIGTAPLTVTSTTNITNLNADYLDGYHASNLTTISIIYVIDGGGSVISTGVKGDLDVPINCTIDRATAFSDATGNITVSIWKSTYAAFPPISTGNITASAPVSIVSASSSQDTTLTGWTKAIPIDSVLRFNVDACSNITRATISLRAIRQ